MPSKLILTALVAITSAEVIINGKTMGGGSSSGVTCPGVLHATANSQGSNTYCCVGGTLNLSNCPGWPACTGPTSFDPKSTTLSCASTVPLTASDYNARVSSASDSYYNGIASPTKPAQTSASPTGRGGGVNFSGNVTVSGADMMRPAWIPVIGGVVALVAVGY
ncbi:hypothetical protein VB005_01958 [Metarhizium brunneum]